MILEPRSIGTSPLRWSTWRRCQSSTSTTLVGCCSDSDVAFSLTAMSQVTRPSSALKSNATAGFEKRGSRRHFARGHHTIGKEIVDLVLDRTKTWADDCIGLQGFLLCNTCGGITGLWSRVYAAGTFVRRTRELIETRLHGVDSSATRDGRPGAVQQCRVRAFLAQAPDGRLLLLLKFHCARSFQ